MVPYLQQGKLLYSEICILQYILKDAYCKPVKKTVSFLYILVHITSQVTTTTVRCPDVADVVNN